MYTFNTAALRNAACRVSAA